MTAPKLRREAAKRQNKGIRMEKERVESECGKGVVSDGNGGQKKAREDLGDEGLTKLRPAT